MLKWRKKIGILMLVSLITACSDRHEAAVKETSAVPVVKQTVSYKSNSENKNKTEDIGWGALCLQRIWWENFKTALISEDGRIIDRSDVRLITTSEGQSYGLFFALMMNDRNTFKNILKWTQNNLSKGDLTENLPAWLWGNTVLGWTTIDSNSASDSDLWIAYTLLEAGRIWQSAEYRAMGELLAQLIIAKETIETENYGQVLLPGAFGFVDDKSRIKVNPSYTPLVLTQYLATNFPNSKWPQIHQSSGTIIRDSAAFGFAPDWWVFEDGLNQQPGQSFFTNNDYQSSYDAIRVYLWAGMQNQQNQSETMNHIDGMVETLKRTGSIPEHVSLVDGSKSGEGNISFNAALLPYIEYFDSDLARKIGLKVIAKYGQVEPDAYYTQSLIGFGLGYWQNWYQFDSDNQLVFGQQKCSVE